MRAVLVAAFLVCVAARSYAQDPAPPAEADFAKATELYNAATAAMNDGRHADAARDFLAAYTITKDPVLFFKIGSAYEKAGACTEALAYYERYLNEAKPAEEHVALTRERIDACKAALGQAAPADPAKPETPANTPPAAAAEPAIGSSPNKDKAWLFVGGALAFVTAGAVLAYSTASAEQDLKDLYISNNGMPPRFDDKTRERYDDIQAEGRRYEILSWTSFGIAAGCAVGATIFFLRAQSDDVEVTPVVSPKQTGVTATIRF